MLNGIDHCTPCVVYAFKPEGRNCEVSKPLASMHLPTGTVLAVSIIACT